MARRQRPEFMAASVAENGVPVSLSAGYEGAVSPNGSRGFFSALIGGGIAGTAVDVTLFPLDTLKTRLQSSQGFFKAGGFKGIYNGLTAAAAGSAPGAALFFSTYETAKGVGSRYAAPGQEPLVHMAAASCGEVTACLVRCPTEIVKQRMQTGMHHSAVETIKSVLTKEGFRGLYRGYGSMIAREIPFSLIQFPIWEKSKSAWSAYQNEPVSALQGACCGSAAGGFAAAVTTPLDVIKTRLMLGKDSKGIQYTSMIDTFKRVRTEEGAAKLFSGIGPRVMWISIGGFVFFGVYETSVRKVEAFLSR